MTGTVGIRHGENHAEYRNPKILLSDWYQMVKMGQTKTADIGILLKRIQETAILFQYWLAEPNQTRRIKLCLQQTVERC